MNVVLGAFIPTIREIAHNLGEYLHESDEDVQLPSVTKVAQLFIHLTSTNTKYADMKFLSRPVGFCNISMQG